MAASPSVDESRVAEQLVDELKLFLWGKDITSEVFRRWTQGFEYSEDETTALIQHEGGPCAVLAPVQAYLLKNLLFGPHKLETVKWKELTEDSVCTYLCSALSEIMEQLGVESYTLVQYQPREDTDGVQEDGNVLAPDGSSTLAESEGESSPKKRRFDHEQFHSSLRCVKCGSIEELRSSIANLLPSFQRQYGVLLFLYSVILTKGIEQIKNEVEDPGEPLIDGTYGHGSQSLINLLLCGRGVSNVWDNDRDISGLKLQGIYRQSTIGFLTLLEHLRYCEVGWYLKNPLYPIWVLGSETHLTVLFSQEQSLVQPETKEGSAKRIFGTFDPEGNGFIQALLLGDVLQALDLVSEPAYVDIVREKLDPEQLGIILLNNFMEEFFPEERDNYLPESFILYHYNGLKRSCVANKVVYRESTAKILEIADVVIVTNTSPVKTCLQTKWPTLELEWQDGLVPSLN